MKRPHDVCISVLNFFSFLLSCKTLLEAASLVFYFFLNTQEPTLNILYIYIYIYYFNQQEIQIANIE